MDPKSRKELINAYKNKPAVGGVYCIECSGSGRRLLKSTVDMEGIKNRFAFAMSINSCPDPAISADWAQYGGSSLTFTVLEELKKTEAQSQKEFRDDVKTLLELWQDKEANGDHE